MGAIADSPHLEYSEAGGARVFAIQSVQLLNNIATKLEEDFARLYAQPGPRNVVVDMGRVTYLSSVGVTALVALRQHVKTAGGEIVLCGLTPPVTTVLRMCKLIAPEAGGPSVFPTEPDVAAAVRRLSGVT
jgi:anti-anti-sigma factor